MSDAYEREFSYESVRKWYRKVGAVLPIPQKIRSHVIAVDETKLKITGKHAFVWSAIDVRRYEVLAVKATGGITELEAIFFLKDTLKYCIGRPTTILLDHGPAMQNVFPKLTTSHMQVLFPQSDHQMPMLDTVQLQSRALNGFGGSWSKQLYRMQQRMILQFRDSITLWGRGRESRLLPWRLPESSSSAAIRF